MRELHTYGQLVATEDKRKENAQHMGFGRRLMDEAERLAAARGYTKVRHCGHAQRWQPPY